MVWYSSAAGEKENENKICELHRPVNILLNILYTNKKTIVTTQKRIFVRRGADHRIGVLAKLTNLLKFLDIVYIPPHTILTSAYQLVVHLL